jgi:hypothetical protein
MTTKQVIRSGRVCLVRGEGILTAIRRNTIWILRKSPTRRSHQWAEFPGGCSLLCFTKEIFPFGFPRHCRKTRWKSGGDY